MDADNNIKEMQEEISDLEYEIRYLTINKNKGDFYLLLTKFTEYRMKIDERFVQYIIDKKQIKIEYLKSEIERNKKILYGNK